MEISKELVSRMASLSKISLDDGQVEKMQGELGKIINYMEILNRADVRDEEPLSPVVTATDFLREDIAEESYDRAELLRNAPVHKEDTVVVPKTVE